MTSYEFRRIPIGFQAEQLMPVSSIAICKLLFTLTHSQKKLMTVLTSPVDGTSVVIEVPMALSADIGLVKETLPDSLQSTERCADSHSIRHGIN